MDAQALGAWMGRRRAPLRLSLRITVACLLTFALGHLLHLAQSYWAVLTAIIVTQASVGGSLKAVVDRFVGSLGGAAWGVVVSLLIPHASAPMLGVALLVGVAPLAVVAAFYPQYRVAPVTAIILLITPSTLAIGPVMSAVSRMFEVGLGSVVAVAVGLTVLPERGHGALSAAGGGALSLMAELTTVLLTGLSAPRDPRQVERLHDAIRGAVRKVEAAADETARERRIYLTDAPDPDPFCRTLRRLQHDLVMIGRMSGEPFAAPLQDSLVPTVSAAGAAVSQIFSLAGAAVAARAPPPSMAALDAALAELAGVITSLRGSGVTRDLSDEAVGRIFGIVFALEQLRQNLSDLADRVRERASPTHLRRGGGQFPDTTAGTGSSLDSQR